MAFLTFVLRHALPHKFLDKSNWEGLVRGEVDGAFGGGEALKFVLEGLDHRRGREQTAVVRKRGEPHQHSVVLERRNPVADRLGGFRWHNGANRRAKLLQGVARRLRNGRKILVKAFRSAGAFRCRTPL